MTDREGRRAVLIALVGIAALALLWPLTWYWSRMLWLETGAALPTEITIEETLYTHMEVEFCAEAVYRIDETVAEEMNRRGASYFSTLGPNREGAVLSWQPAESFLETSGARSRRQFSDGPFCVGGGPPDEKRMWDWPSIPVYAPSAYVADDGRGTLLIVNPEERLAYFWNQ